MPKPPGIHHGTSPTKAYRKMVVSSTTPDMSTIKEEYIKDEFTPSPHMLDHAYVTPRSQMMTHTPPSGT